MGLGARDLQAIQGEFEARNLRGRAFDSQAARERAVGYSAIGCPFFPPRERALLPSATAVDGDGPSGKRPAGQFSRTRPGNPSKSTVASAYARPR